MQPKAFSPGSSAWSSTPSVAIERLDVSAYVIPTERPESDGTFEWDHTTLVVVHAKAGDAVGLGYTYGDPAVATVVSRTLSGRVVGGDAMDVSRAWIAMNQAVRNAGRPGIASGAIAAVDIALWDLKARLQQLPLVALLGSVRDEIEVYGSGGFTSCTTSALQRQLAGWVADGIPAVKMKVGRDSDADAERVGAARAAIGDDAELFVDANGAWTPALALMMAERFERHRVSWFEEPVTADDLDGLRRVRERAPAGMEIAAGEYGYDPIYFRRMLDAGAVDVLQADATRCGGITGFLAVGALSDAYAVPLSAHTAPSLHGPLCCAVARARHVEYFYDHARIESMLFDGRLRPHHGRLRPDRARPGLGLELKEADADRFRVM